MASITCHGTDSGRLHDTGESASHVERLEVDVRGIVQGVGFRPFIYTQAHKHQLAGLVRNDAEGVHIEAEGPPERLRMFLDEIASEAPPLAMIEAMSCRSAVPRGEAAFRIVESAQGARRRALVSPELATCGACLRELFDPRDRRYRYPFINCTHCGPRFTITRSVPYDRVTTTMAAFPMCSICQGEYDDPADRRFHAQPNACPACGPRVRLLDGSGADMMAADPIRRTAELLRAGAVVAVKGLGGYHLACDPFNAEPVRALRGRKARQGKPFALMAQNLDQIRALCHVHPEEEALLVAPARPVVLLDVDGHASTSGPAQSAEDPQLAAEVAARHKTLGFMLAYTPLHHVLLNDVGFPLVMTSGNRSDEPIAYKDEEVLEHLTSIADFFLVHNRPIHMRCDDSVTRVWGGHSYPVRRSRGYAPAPLRVATGFNRHILACGGELKNTFCLLRDHRAFVSHYIGDLANYETLRSFQEGIEHYRQLFDVHPQLVAHDLHPEYLSTKYALELEERGLPAVGVQHHHAHIASCLADNERPVDERAIGVAFDGTGYGTDGAIWGGEFLEGSVECGFTRRGHLQYVPLPGGEAAIRQPWRMALAYLLCMDPDADVVALPPKLLRQAGLANARKVAQIIRARINTPRTSSAGRLFDAVAALLDVHGAERPTYEGQAAIELELAADGPTSRGYPFHLRDDHDLWLVETTQIIAAVMEDLRLKVPAAGISASFHRTMADVAVSACERIRDRGGVQTVALSGGTFQNMLLLDQSVSLLTASGFSVYTHRRVPTNDGGLSLGQAVLADSTVRQLA